MIFPQWKGNYYSQTLHSLFYFIISEYNQIVLVPPSIITRPSDQTIIENKRITFHCTATGNPIPKVSWLKGGETVAKGETLSFEANRNQSGNYWCSVENGLGITVNASAHLNVQCKWCIAYLPFHFQEWSKRNFSLQFLWWNESLQWLAFGPFEV